MPSTPGEKNFPTTLDDAISLIEANNQASSTLTAGITSTSLLIPVADPGEFPNSGLATLTDSITPWLKEITTSQTSAGRITDESTSDGGIAMYFEPSAAETINAEPDTEYQYGIKVLTSDGKVHTMEKGFIPFTQRAQEDVT